MSATLMIASLSKRRDPRTDFSASRLCGEVERSVSMGAESCGCGCGIRCFAFGETSQ